MPSITFPPVELAKIVAAQRYEERMLFLALLLRNPGLRIVYVTSSPVDPSVVDYYLRFLPDPHPARSRLHLVDLDDPSTRALSEKILDRPGILAALRELAPQGGTMLPFNVTPAEARLAEELGLELCGPPSRLVPLGSKSGSRRVAARAGVARIEGAEDLFSVAEVAAAISGIRARRPSAEAVVVKLNNGFSGQGNAILELDGLGDPLPASKTTFCANEESWPTFAAKIEEEGAIVEELLRGEGLESPSAQLRIAADASVELLSTHDQILGGPEGQVYLGCRFPASAEYRAAITEEALRVGAVLATEGVVGSFGIDFLVVPGEGVYLSEINLRMGGTTHPYWMARLATGAGYDTSRGELVAPDGRPVRYVATDNLKSQHLAELAPADVIARVDDAGLAFDPATGTGATLHLLGAVPGYGKMGATCIAASIEDADDLYRRLVAVLTNR
ncbi:MAG TPA: peptide ligase PGM1-related protein [Acidimicrobiales bacterium]|nr:peptide ligase PGM1-related protein [Acidimicrobiales bacterium]